MDYTANRNRYMSVYNSYFTSLTLTEHLLNDVMNLFPALWQSGQPLLEVTIKSYILLELTKTRESCDFIIGFLRNSGDAINAGIADRLEEFNTSPGRQTYGDEIEIPVTLTQPTELNLPNTKNYPLTKLIRGKAIVVNLVPELVLSEGKRFAHIFRCLRFDVELIDQRQNTKDIVQYLSDLAFNMNLAVDQERDQAFILMVIGHGQDEMIKGVDHPDCGNGGNDWSDIWSTNDLVDMFANVNGLVKMFFFTCCRFTTNGGVTCSNVRRPSVNTFVYRSCAQGYGTITKQDYTPYGRALSESFAQYAHDQDLTTIITRGYQLLRSWTTQVSGDHLGWYAPCSEHKCPDKKVFFNPGYPPVT